MSSFEKLYERIMATPTRKDISPIELSTFLSHYGIRPSRISGSHHIYKIGKRKISIPIHGQIKTVYINDVKKAINQLEGK